MTPPAKARSPRTRSRKSAVPPLAETPRPGYAPIATERLSLRAFEPEDATALHRLINDWQLTRNLALVPFPYPRDLADTWIASTRSNSEPRCKSQVNPLPAPSSNPILTIDPKL